MKTSQTQKKSIKKKERKLNILSLLLSLFSVIFIIGGALGIYYFSKGYRLNISDRQIKRTGVLTVQSEPSSAQLYINGNSVGRTPRGRTLDIGTHDIAVKKEGYKEWEKKIEIVEEKSTPMYPFLVLQEPIPSNIWQSDGGLEKFWTNEDRDYFVFLLVDSSEQYSLWTYRINTPLWNLNTNPVAILSLETNNIRLDISPNGQLAIMHLTEEDQENSYLIDLTKTLTLDNLDPIEILPPTYELTWSKDNKHIILESADEIISVDTSVLENTTINSTFTLVEKEPETQYLWSTDEEGFFYILEKLSNPDDTTYIYALKQLQPDGTDTKYTIEKAYFQKNRDFIEHYRENGDTYPEFANSSQSTQAIGKINYFEVNQTSNGVYISTDTSTYWYDISTNRYRMICTHPAQLISFSPNSKKVLFVNGNYIYVFTLEKEEGDHTKEIGTKKVIGLKKNAVSEIDWLSNSTHIHYKKEGILHISEEDGGNEMQVLDAKNIQTYSIKDNREYIVTLEVKDLDLEDLEVKVREEDPLQINQYKIK
jgi:hypothetical protein